MLTCGSAAILCLEQVRATSELKLELPPVVSYTVMGGLASLPGHTIAVAAFDQFDRCPVLREVSVPSALTFGVFEFGFYWCAILCIAMLLQRVGKGWARLMRA